ncbi:hypothetical protein MTsN3n11_28910 [Qipengyuania sp. MTN3-11]
MPSKTAQASMVMTQKMRAYLRGMLSPMKRYDTGLGY